MKWTIMTVCLAASFILVSSSVWISQLFQYNGLAVSHGEIWRLFTAHLVHISWSHLAQNVTGLMLLQIVFPALRDMKTVCVLYLISGVSITLVYYFSFPAHTYYVGFSGVLHAFASYAIITRFAEEKLLLLLSIALLGAKLGYELVFMETGDTATEVHFTGTLAGAIVAFCSIMLDKSAHRGVQTG